MNHNFNILLFGSSRVGKTTFLTRYVSGHFLADPNLQDRCVLKFGSVKFNIDVSLEYKEGYDAYILMFDITNLKTLLEHRVNTTKPLVILGNKVDIKYTSGRSRAKCLALYSLLDGRHYYDVSAKSLYNYDKPFTYLAKRLIE